VRRTQHLEDAVETLLADDVAHAHEVDVLRRDLDGEIALGDLELEVHLLFAANLAGLDLFDQRRAVVRVDNRLAYCERHLQMSPFPDTRLPRRDLQNLRPWARGGMIRASVYAGQRGSPQPGHTPCEPVGRGRIVPEP